MTSVGLDSTATAAATRAGVSRLRESDQFNDTHGNPIIESCIPWLPADDEPSEVEDALAADSDDEDAAGLEMAAGDDEDAEADNNGALDPYDLARQTDDLRRVLQAAEQCFADLLEAHFPPRAPEGNTASLAVCVAGGWRPGPRFEGAAQEVAKELLISFRRRVPRADLTIIPTGNAAAIHGLALATQRVAANPMTVCVVAAIDSLLPLETLEWYESAGRLKSASPGRNHGLPPAEAVGFLVVETAQSAQRAGRQILAEISGIGLAIEPNPFLSDRSSRGQGLTEACRKALATSGVPAGDVGAVLADLDGEFHRAKEWALAETRCFGSAGAPALIHPADCFGSVGAASAAVLLGIAAIGLVQGRFTKPVLVICSDDAGECGAVMLTPRDDVQRN